MSSLNGRNTNSVFAKTADFTIVTPDHQKAHYTNEGATGAVNFNLPAATKGQEYSFGVVAAQTFNINPNGTDKVCLPTTGVPGAAGKGITHNTAGMTARLVCLTAGLWQVMGSTGTWTAIP